MLCWSSGLQIVFFMEFLPPGPHPMHHWVCLPPTSIPNKRASKVSENSWGREWVKRSYPRMGRGDLLQVHFYLIYVSPFLGTDHIAMINNSLLLLGNAWAVECCKLQYVRSSSAWSSLRKMGAFHLWKGRSWNNSHLRGREHTGKPVTFSLGKIKLS